MLTKLCTSGGTKASGSVKIRDSWDSKGLEMIGRRLRVKNLLKPFCIWMIGL